MNILQTSLATKRKLYIIFYFNILNILFFCFIAICNAEDGDIEDRKLFDLLLYGDFSYKSTNFLKDDYNAISGWAEQRLVLTFVRYDENKAGFITPNETLSNSNLFTLFCPNPYLKFTEAASSAAGFTSFTVEGFPYHYKGRIPYENNFVWGGGLENRFLERLDDIIFNNTLKDKKYLDWIRSCRFYAEYLNLEYLEEDWWQSDFDFRAGVDLWKEWNVPGGTGGFSKVSLFDLLRKSENETKKSTKAEGTWLWGEVYQDLSYRETNFYLNDYDSLFFVSTGKLGVRLYDYWENENSKDNSDWSVHIMPYIKGEVAASEKDYFWENRAKAGVGLRIMPRIKISEKNELLLRFYGEYLGVVDYFKDDPVSGTPWDDYMIGVNFSINRH